MSFLTGSRIYGTPNPESDWDLVVLLSPEDAERLWVAFAEDDPDAKYPSGAASFPLRFGSLNLLVCTTAERYDSWRLGTALLRAAYPQKPVTRDEAIDAFQRLFAEESRGVR